MWFSLTVDRRTELVGVARNVTCRLAQCAGCADEEAAAMGEAIGEVLAGNLHVDPTADTAPFVIHYSTDEGAFEILLSWHGGDLTPGPTAGQVMEIVECGRTGNTSYCRMVRRMPAGAGGADADSSCA